MKRKIIYGTFMLALLASCSNEEMVATSQSLANRKPLGVNVGIVQEGLQSKAIVGTATFTEPIGVYIGGGTYGTPTKYSKCSYVDPNWSIVDPLYLSSSVATVYGFYPYTATTTDVDLAANTLKVTIPATANFDGSDLKDYMYATAAGTGTNPTVYSLATASNAGGKEQVSLYFHHAMAKLTFKIIKDAATYPSASAGKLTKIELTGPANTFKVGDFNMNLSDGATAGNLSGTGNATTITLNKVNDEIIQTGTDGMLHPTTGSNYCAQTLVAPISLPTGTPDSDANSIKLTLVVDGTSLSTYLPKAVNNWVAGTNYTYTITVKGKALQINPTVTVVGFANSETTIPNVDMQ